MKHLLRNSKIMFLGLFAVACVGIWTYQFVYALPKARCERDGGWFYGPDRLCGVPIEIRHITGRPNPTVLPDGTLVPAPDTEVTPLAPPEKAG
jgi:hypothetical protein